LPAKLAGASVEYGSFWYYCGIGVVMQSAGFVLNQYILKKRYRYDFKKKRYAGA
jgi:hypothetical protein